MKRATILFDSIDLKLLTIIHLYSKLNINTSQLSKMLEIAPVHVISHRKRLEFFGLLTTGHIGKGYRRTYIISEKGIAILKLLDEEVKV